MLHDPGQRQVAVGRYGIDQPLLAELTKLVLRLGDAVTKSNENVTGVKLYRFFLIIAIREEPHHGASLVQAAHGAIARENDRGKMAGVGISETVFDVVIKTQEQ